MCLANWPCVPAKVALLEEFRTFPSVLLIYLSAQMWDAVDDTLRQGQLSPPSSYHERFVSWARWPIG
ncbi:hypothetical protein AB0F81_19980 [Actinoplanes sp. NPDC024001]|uniref:hypothetical protein n=1 Tax=Actinoplanes sp. NPDC024001 TaxID=3154598 RepID=UPI0033F600F3